MTTFTRDGGSWGRDRKRKRAIWGQEVCQESEKGQGNRDECDFSKFDISTK